jgi:fructose-1,6-bisphosphatase/sedoheptulose 1,7-bisphosphatase-like protein
MKNSIKVVAMLALLGLALCGNLNIRESNNSNAVRYIDGADCAQLEAKGYQIAKSGSAVFYLDNIAGMNQLNFYCTAVSTGNFITTADLRPVYSTGENLTKNVTLTSGTDVTAFASSFYKMTIYNNFTATQNVTMNILVTK